MMRGKEVAYKANLARKASKLSEQAKLIEEADAAKSFEFTQEAERLNKLSENMQSHVYFDDGTSEPLANLSFRFTDNKNFNKYIKSSSKKIINSKDKMPISLLDYSDGDSKLRASADFAGNLFDASGAPLKATPEFSDSLYALLGNNLKNSHNFAKNLIEKKAILNIDITKAPYQQLDYLSELRGQIGEDAFRKIFNIK